MVSFNVSRRAIAWAIALAIASLPMVSWEMAAASDSSSATSGNRLNKTALSDLEAEVLVQLGQIAPVGMRIDHVMLTCDPSAGSTLKAIVPGVNQFASRSFMVELVKDERSSYCSATMEASRRVLVANRDLQSGETVVDSDFQSQWIDAFGVSAGALSEFPHQGPYVSATFLRAGQPLFQNTLVRPIAVHAGDTVTVLVKNGPVTVHAQLQAQSQAPIGDSVTVVNPAGGTPVMVTVTGPKSAELVLQ